MSDYVKAEELAAAEQAIFNAELDKLTGAGKTDSTPWNRQARGGSWLHGSGERQRTNHAFFDAKALEALGRLGYDTSQPPNESPGDAERKRELVHHLGGYIRITSVFGGSSDDGIRNQIESHPWGHLFKRRDRSTAPEMRGLPGDPRPLANAPDTDTEAENGTAAKGKRRFFRARKTYHDTPEQLAALKEEAELAGIPENELIRRAVNDEIEDRRARRKG